MSKEEQEERLKLIVAAIRAELDNWLPRSRPTFLVYTTPWKNDLSIELAGAVIKTLEDKGILANMEHSVRTFEYCSGATDAGHY